mmetsp:Transcript_15139/g.29881  ORF Transcript_15139/g.29881 Transcript_15139/m.29881 type:complete len:455 (+) Transcript_15139:915-2279(+)
MVVLGHPVGLGVHSLARLGRLVRLLRRHGVLGGLLHGVGRQRHVGGGAVARRLLAALAVESLTLGGELGIEVSVGVGAGDGGEGHSRLSLEIHLGCHEGIHEEASREVLDKPPVHVVRVAGLDAGSGQVEGEEEVRGPANVRGVEGGDLANHASDPDDKGRKHDGGVDYRHEGREELHVHRVRRHKRRKQRHDERGEARLDVGEHAADLEGLEPLGEVPKPRDEAGGGVDLGLHRVVLARAQQRRAHEAQHQRQREPHAHRHGTQRTQRLRPSALGGRAAAPEERDGAHALGEAPVHALEGGGLEETAGADRVVDVRPRVGRRHKVEGDSDDAQEVEPRLDTRPVRLHHVEEAVVGSAARQRVEASVGEVLGSLRGGLAADVAHGLAVGAGHVNGDCLVERELGGALHLDAERTEEDEEDKGVADGREEAADDDLADGAAARDAGNEHADKGHP